MSMTVACMQRHMGSREIRDLLEAPYHNMPDKAGFLGGIDAVIIPHYFFLH